MVDNPSTIIGQSILVNGNLQGDEDLTVVGRVHGSVNLSRTLTVEESGIVKADVNVRNAVISGVMVGNLTASESVEITDVGRMVGDIKAPRVIVVDGAKFRGTVDMGDLEAPRASGPLPARTVARSGTSTTGIARTTSMPARPASTTPVRRPSPPPAAPAAKPAAAVVPAKAAPKKAPVAGKKKLKKKVVVKKRG